MKMFHSVLAIAVVLGATACGAGSRGQIQETTVAEAPSPRTSGSVTARGDDEVHARVGRSGGTLELANGARLEIPPGALAEETEVTLSLAPAAREAWDEETKRALGPVLEIEPPIHSAGDPFVISCPAAMIPSGFQEDDLALGNEEEVGGTHLGGATATRWQMWPAAVRASRFVAELSSLGGHRIQFGVSR